jgi:hypothetical protein
MSDGLTVPFAFAAGLTGAVAASGIVELLIKAKQLKHKRTTTLTSRQTRIWARAGLESTL